MSKRSKSVAPAAFPARGASGCLPRSVNESFRKRLLGSSGGSLAGDSILRNRPLLSGFGALLIALAPFPPSPKPRIQNPQTVTQPDEPILSAIDPIPNTIPWGCASGRSSSMARSISMWRAPTICSRRLPAQRSTTSSMLRRRPCDFRRTGRATPSSLTPAGFSLSTAISRARREHRLSARRGAVGRWDFDVDQRFGPHRPPGIAAHRPGRSQYWRAGGV